MSCLYAYYDTDELKRDKYAQVKCKNANILASLPEDGIAHGKCLAQRVCKNKGRSIVSERAMFFCKNYKKK